MPALRGAPWISQCFFQEAGILLRLCKRISCHFRSVWPLCADCCQAVIACSERGWHLEVQHLKVQQWDVLNIEQSRIRQG